MAGAAMRQAQCMHVAGKTTHLAQLMKDEGCVIALDRSHAKAQHIRSGPLSSHSNVPCMSSAFA